MSERVPFWHDSKLLACRNEIGQAGLLDLDFLLLSLSAARSYLVKLPPRKGFQQLRAPTKPFSNFCVQDDILRVSCRKALSPENTEITRAITELFLLPAAICRVARVLVV